MQLTQIPLGGLMEVARHMGAVLPDRLAAEGTVSGSVTYREEGVARGASRVAGRVADAAGRRSRCEASSAAVEIGRRADASGTGSMVNIGEKDSAEVEGITRRRSRTIWICGLRRAG